ncbi:HpcH/HpaI aldolase/citrate lyase family protein (plasmid) [Bradyrhizobium sp. Pa8]|uniref:HpcH/HpaI aldolase/citrate lyase family protein n=1 Tax=Bradyrhizobium sp. Pa8 TaxID=3386552 RepID=UPI00403F75DB
MSGVSALALGATLCMPCTREDLADALLGPKRVPGLRSVVLCLEDAVLERDLPVALTRLSFLRSELSPNCGDGQAGQAAAVVG